MREKIVNNKLGSIISCVVIYDVDFGGVFILKIFRSFDVDGFMLNGV